MSARYDDVAAAHYAAYRPPLHDLILRRALGADASFPTGVDVGCGTGRSTVALAARCGRVYGVDPSPAMLAAATAHEGVTYLAGRAERLPLADGLADVVTFAGSLSYADPARYDRMRDRYVADDPLAPLERELASGSARVTVPVALYHSTYRVALAPH